MVGIGNECHPPMVKVWPKDCCVCFPFEQSQRPKEDLKLVMAIMILMMIMMLKMVLMLTMMLRIYNVTEDNAGDGRTMRF